MSADLKKSEVFIRVHKAEIFFSSIIRNFLHGRAPIILIQLHAVGI
jgi:hypothetical protein